MTKTSTQTTPGAQRAASPRRSAPEAILEQCLANGRAGTERGGKDGPQAGVEVQFTARQCVQTTLDGSQVVEGRPRSKTPPESSRWSMSGDQVALGGSQVVRGVRARRPLYHGADSSARIDANGRRSRCPQPGRTAPRTTPGAPLILASEYDPNPLPSRARRYPVFLVEIHCQKQELRGQDGQSTSGSLQAMPVSPDDVSDLPTAILPLEKPAKGTRLWE